MFYRSRFVTYLAIYILLDAFHIHSCASLSSGLEAAQSSTFKELRRPEFCSKTVGEWSITCWSIWLLYASTSSATHQALENKLKSLSMATTCKKSWEYLRCKCFIMQSNLFSSHSTGWSLKYFGVLQLQEGNTSPVTVSSTPMELPQMLACWLMQRAQIQYWVSSIPLSASLSHKISSSPQLRLWATPSQRDRCNASASTAATRSRNRLAQWCVTILR